MTAYPTLPALRSLHRLADIRPTVIIDTREQDPLPIQRLPAIRDTLQSGDYSFTGGARPFRRGTEHRCRHRVRYARELVENVNAILRANRKRRP